MDKQSSNVQKREIFGWAMYDFANSSYTTVVVTFVYSAFFISYIVPPELAHLKNSFWSLAVVISTALAIFIAPLSGAICDAIGHRKRFLGVCTAISVLATAGLFFVNPGDVVLGITLLVLSNTAWMVSESFVASFLPELSTPKTIGRISGIGWGIGYIGGLSSLIALFLIVTVSPSQDLARYIDQTQLAMLFVAGFYLLGALPTFLFVKERAFAQSDKQNFTLGKILKQALSRTISITSLRKNSPTLFQFFIAFMVYSAGIAVVVKFFGIYAQEEIGITGSQLIAVGATLQLSAMIGAFIFGIIEDKLGVKTTILLSMGWWCLGILGIYWVIPIAQLLNLPLIIAFTGLAFIAGSALGATQSSSRSLVGRLAKPFERTLMFGLWGTFGRLAIILGMTFGPVSDLLGRQSALLFILVYFVIGGFLLAKIDLPNRNDV